MNERAQELFEQHRSFAVAAARPHLRRAWVLGLDLEDLVQEALIGLWKAALRFDPSRGASFKNYAFIWMRGAVRDGMKSFSGRMLTRLKLPQVVLSARQRTGAALPERSAPRVDVEAAFDVRAAASALGLRDGAIVMERAGGRTLKSVGSQFGVSEARACQIYRRALPQLRSRLSAYGAA